MKDKYVKAAEKATGVNIPDKPFREDGYVNAMNKYGTAQDTSEYYQFMREPYEPDMELEAIYEGNGLFARIIDAPAEEATRKGFTLDGVKDEKIADYYTDALDNLDWEEKAQECIKWARLYGGSIAVMVIDDGRGLEEPVDEENIKGVKELVVYPRCVLMPDYNTMYSYGVSDPLAHKGRRIGTPEYYYVYSKYGSFKVHETRCLVFKNGKLPERCTNLLYEHWGMPEYIRIKRELRSAEVAHQNGPKMLDKSVQAVYRMKGLSEVLAREDGDDVVVKRLQAIDLARGLLDTIAIDADGEDYRFETFSYTGVSDIINITCNMLSAITNIPQTILFGRSPSGMDATGHSDLENWYNFIERIQKKSLKGNLRRLLKYIFIAGKNNDEIDEIPNINIKFDPLWSLSETEQVQLEQMKASVQATKAQTAATYVQMGVLDPSEIRKALADEDVMDIDTMLDDIPEDELMANMPQQQQGGMPGMPGGGAPGGDMMQALMGQMGAQGANPQEEQTAPAPKEQPQEATRESQPQAETSQEQQGQTTSTEVPIAGQQVPQKEEPPSPQTTEQPETPQNKPTEAPQAQTEETSTKPSNEPKNGSKRLYRRLLITQDGKVLAGVVKRKGQEYIDCPRTVATEDADADVRGLAKKCGVKDGVLTQIGDTGLKFLVTDIESKGAIDPKILAEPKLYTIEELNASKIPLTKQFRKALNAVADRIAKSEDTTQEDDATSVIGEAEAVELAKKPIVDSGTYIPEEDLSAHMGAPKEKKPVDLDKVAYDYINEQLQKVMEEATTAMASDSDSAAKRNALLSAVYKINGIVTDALNITKEPLREEAKELINNGQNMLAEFWKQV
ncbi:MAG: DUF1073 domain-containing protein [Clostridia bacterium]|nr:DUF1073 domain-containing protein [Clostridia bacterium]